jgi:hypothetical protein
MTKRRKPLEEEVRGLGGQWGEGFIVNGWVALHCLQEPAPHRSFAQLFSPVNCHRRGTGSDVLEGHMVVVLA